jgi:hypothetical protein
MVKPFIAFLKQIWMSRPHSGTITQPSPILPNFVVGCLKYNQRCQLFGSGNYHSIETSDIAND